MNKVEDMSTFFIIDMIMLSIDRPNGQVISFKLSGSYLDDYLYPYFKELKERIGEFIIPSFSDNYKLRHHSRHFMAFCTFLDSNGFSDRYVGSIEKRLKKDRLNKVYKGLTYKNI